MATPHSEVALHGGRVTAGVVRVGNTVRRPSSANSDFIRRLLDHLSTKGFPAAPRHLGVDDQGRDVLSFIDGEVPAELGFQDDAALRDAASLIRRFHDLGAELVAGGAEGGAEVACHNDLSPCNFVFQAGAPVAMIDFDAAAPGSRLDDLGYAAWLWLDLGSPDVAPPEQRRRLRLFVEAYGMHDTRHVVDGALRRQGLLAEEGDRRGDVAMAAWAKQCRAWTRRHMRDR